jgi:hypothetical protein
MNSMRKFLISSALALSLVAINFGFPTLSQGGLIQSTTARNGTVHGQVLLGPICPVQRNPPDPACAPKPYKTTISILRTTSGVVYKKVATSSAGRFTLSLSPGMYVLRARGGSVYPRCTDTRVKVLARKSLTVIVNCDTGIR